MQSQRRSMLDDLREETPRERRRRRAVKLLLHASFAAMGYGALCVGARLLHRRVVFQPPADAAVELPKEATLLRAVAKDGTTVHALELRPAATTKARPRTIVHFHGNAETADDNVGLARDLVRHGFVVVLGEYRGYGRSRGAPPTEAGVYADAEAILDALAERGTPSWQITLWGQSLGAAVALEMATRGRGSKLALVAPFTSTVDLADRVVPFLPTSFVMVDRFDNLAKAPRVDVPTLVVHGDADDVVPFAHGEQLGRTLPRASLHAIRGGHHDDLYKDRSALAAIVAHAE